MLSGCLLGLLVLGFQYLRIDDEKEFYKQVQALVKWKDILHFTTSGDTNASVVE